MADTVANALFQGADVDWYSKADNIILRNVNQSSVAGHNQPQNQNIQEKK